MTHNQQSAINYLSVFKHYTKVIGNTEGNQISKTHGGEWKSACPKCGGNDRLCLWPNRHAIEANKPDFWCRGCNWSGQIVHFVLYNLNKQLPSDQQLTLRTRNGRETIQKAILSTQEDIL